jgi:hypothetical protein
MSKRKKHGLLTNPSLCATIKPSIIGGTIMKKLISLITLLILIMTQLFACATPGTDGDGESVEEEEKEDEGMKEKTYYPSAEIRSAKGGASGIVVLMHDDGDYNTALVIDRLLEKYGLVAGTDVFGEKIKKSIGLLMASSIPYEFRTTVVNELHCEDDFHKIGELIRGASAYYIQCFKDSGNILSDGLSAPTKEALEKYLQIAKQYVENTSLRGVD